MNYRDAAADIRVGVKAADFPDVLSNEELATVKACWIRCSTRTGLSSLATLAALFDQVI